MLARLPKELSGGQRQRVALARAIIRTPQVFLMDEPLSNLDAKLRVQMRAELKHLQHELQVTTIYVTHDQIEAMTLAHRVAVMNKGVIEQLGTPKEIYNNPRTLFVAGFIGSPPMNLIPGRSDERRVHRRRLRVGGPRQGKRRPGRAGRPSGGRPCGRRQNAGANLMAPIYSVELTGESTLVSVRVGGQLMTLRADKNFVGRFDQQIGVSVADGARLPFRCGKPESHRFLTSGRRPGERRDVGAPPPPMQPHRRQSADRNSRRRVRLRHDDGAENERPRRVLRRGVCHQPHRDHERAIPRFIDATGHRSGLLRRSSDPGTGRSAGRRRELGRCRCVLPPLRAGSALGAGI